MSRTDHARPPRNPIQERERERRPRHARQRFLDERTEIQEQIATTLDLDERLNIPGLRRRRSWWSALYTYGSRAVCSHGYEAWENSLLDRDCCTEYVLPERDADILREQAEDEQEGLLEAWRLRQEIAPWEVDLPDEVVYSDLMVEETLAKYDQDPYAYLDVDEDMDEDREVFDEDEQPHWLGGDLREFFDALGEAYVIEGPSITEPSIKARGYMRVHELARRIDVPSAAVVRALRLCGEYVTSHTSYIALPVAEVWINAHEEWSA